MYPEFFEDVQTETMAKHLVQKIRQWQSVAVAFSGGVDSAVVAKAAELALGGNAIAVTAVSRSLASSERAIAVAVADDIGIRHVEVLTNEFQNPGYSANPSNRCYFCKSTLYRAMTDKLSDWNVEHLVNGTNYDDFADHRPGLIAADEFQVLSPLAELKFTKHHIRQLASYWQLTVADKPASPCLSSRIAYGIEVTEERVGMVEQAESAIRRFTTIREFRVRMEADCLARIEVPVDDLPQLLSETVRSKLVQELQAAGFRTITIDLEGFRSGRMNDRLPSSSQLPHVELKIPK